jgi:hypothetical protein
MRIAFIHDGRHIMSEIEMPAKPDAPLATPSSGHYGSGWERYERLGAVR